MKWRFGPGELEVEIEHDPNAFGGRGGVTVTIVPAIKLRLALEDAESIGDALIAVVRSAEQQES